MLKTINFITACAIIGQPELRLQTNTITDRYQKIVSDYYEINVIADAINKERNFVPDFSDRSQWKYFVYFKYDPSSGVGFSYYDCADWYAVSAVGSRLCFDSAEIAEYFGKLIIKLGYQI